MYIEAVMAETDCFCVADDHGHKVCEPAHCDAGKEKVTKLPCSLYSVCFMNPFLLLCQVQNQLANKQDECFCVRDHRGNEICEPPGCKRWSF